MGESDGTGRTKGAFTERSGSKALGVVSAGEADLPALSGGGRQRKAYRSRRERWLERYGIAQAHYCDKKNSFVGIREPTIEDANRSLREVHLPKINQKFAKVPAQLQDAHVPRAQVTVRELLDGRIKLLYQNTELEYVELEYLPHKEELATRSA